MRHHLYTPVVLVALVMGVSNELLGACLVGRKRVFRVMKLIAGAAGAGLMLLGG